MTRERRRAAPWLAGLLLGSVPLVAATGLAPSPPEARVDPARPPRLREVARSDRQWTGIAVTRDGRLFVNYPRWSDAVPVSVAEVLPGGEAHPVPDADWNRWEPGLSPAEHFVCVQSVVADDLGFLWVLDPANPRFAGVVPGGAKLLKLDPKSGRILQRILFDHAVAPRDSYLNDVRIDTRTGHAYLTDSGTGALVVVDLTTGRAWRRLAGHPSTRAEDVTLTIGGRPWLPGGERPRVHSDGIALDPRGGYVYYQALTGRTLYRVPTRLLRDPASSEEVLAGAVESLGQTGAADGIEFGPDGALYLTAIEADAIRRRMPEGRIETLVASEQLAWPDSIAVGPDGALYVTTSRIHLGTGPYLLLKLEGYLDARALGERRRQPEGTLQASSSRATR